MNSLLQFLATNWSGLTSLAGFIVLYVMNIKLEHKMELGFKDIRTELLKINHRIGNHNQEIKGIKKRLKKVESKVFEK